MCSDFELLAELTYLEVSLAALYMPCTELSAMKICALPRYFNALLWQCLS